MKIRLEGTQEEINSLLPGWQNNGISTLQLHKTWKVKSVSKFYPNKAFGFERSEPQKEGRVYIEVE
jgi:hypothetical protein